MLRHGNVIELLPLGARETKRLEVVEACSGIRSLMTLVTLAVVFAYFTHPRSGDSGDGSGGSRGSRMVSRLKTYGFWRSSLLVLSAIPIAILTNALRVSGTGVLAHYYGTQVADGFFHSFSGWVIYVVAFVMLFGVGVLLDRVKPTIAGEGCKTSRKFHRRSCCAGRRSRIEMKNRRFVILLALVLAGGAVVNAWHYVGEAKIERKQLSDFPKQIGNWEQTGGDEQLNNETLAVLRATDYLLRDYRNA